MKKVIVVGERNVGKTTFIQQLTKSLGINQEQWQNDEFDHRIKHLQSSINCTSIKFLDMKGEILYKPMEEKYYGQTSLGVIVFDVTNTMSFLKIGKWIDQVHGYSSARLMVIGMKSDKPRVIPPSSFKQFLEGLRSSKNWTEEQIIGFEGSSDDQSFYTQIIDYLQMNLN